MISIKKIITILTAFALTGCLSACGNTGGAAGGGDSYENIYFAIYDGENTAEELAAIPEFQFMAGDLRDELTNGLRFEITISIEFGMDYTLESRYYNPDQRDENAADYCDIRMQSTGECTIEGDKITIAPPQLATAVYYVGSDYADQEKFRKFSYAEDKGNGEWTAGEWATENIVPEILENVPSGVFTISGNKIVTWSVLEEN